MRWLLEQVLPRLRSVLRNVKLYLVGSDVWVDLAQGHPGAEGRGRVRDLKPYLARARVMLLPTFIHGSGLQTKSLLAIQQGRPFVTTSNGVNGMRSDKDTHRRAFKIGDSPADFANLSVHLFNNAQARRAQVHAMRMHAKRYLSWSNIVKETQGAMFKLVGGACLAPAWQ